MKLENQTVITGVVYLTCTLMGRNFEWRVCTSR